MKVRLYCEFAHKNCLICKHTHKNFFADAQPTKKPAA